MHRSHWRHLLVQPLAFSLCGLFFLDSVAFGKSPTVDSAMQLKPSQKVDIDMPEKAAWSDFRMVPVVGDKEKGWAVIDATGRRLRCFLDTNSDKAVDRWCYYREGVEVYRDIDSNYNRKVDAHRWLGTAGSRWAIDKNEDGRIDRWKRISAEEATAELVAALAADDKVAFSRLLLTQKELDLWKCKN